MQKRQGTKPRNEGARCRRSKRLSGVQGEQGSGEGFFFSREADGFSRTSGEINFCLLDAAEKDFAESIGGFVVQTEMGILFHDIKGVAEFVGEFRLRCADRHGSIVAGRSIGFPGPFFHSSGQRIETGNAWDGFPQAFLRWREGMIWRSWLHGDGGKPNGGFRSAFFGA
jgi:hypothetical protein